MNNKAVINYPLITTDSKGNETHRKYSDGFELWKEYDENINLRYVRDSIGCWWDSKGNMIPNPNLAIEVTFDDIAKKFGVNVKSLKIKK